jgi:AmmeMemoRadiSam system protein A
MTDVFTGKEKMLLLDLARQAVRNALEGGSGESISRVKDDGFTGRLREQKGVFVAIYNRGTLRGCVGTVLEVLPLWQVCAENARSAAIKDVRFSPITRDEIPALTFEITVIGPSRELRSISEFRPGKDGLILKKGFRMEAFLPGSIPNEDIFDRLRAKAGIDPGDDTPEVWEIFETEIISDKIAD